MPHYGISKAVDTYFDERDRARSRAQQARALKKQELAEDQAKRLSRMEERAKYGESVETLEKGFKSMERLRRGALGPEEQDEPYAREEAKSFKQRFLAKSRGRLGGRDLNTMKLGELNSLRTALENDYDRDENDEQTLANVKVLIREKTKTMGGGKEAPLPAKPARVEIEEEPGLMERFMRPFRRKETPVTPAAPTAPTAPAAPKTKKKKNDPAGLY